MKTIVVFTITCNRLDLTKKYLSQLKEKAGYEFQHFIIDNGSTDGTLEYLKKEKYLVLSLKKNHGILPAMKLGIKYAIDKFAPDFIIKFDNDCLIHTNNILQKIMSFYGECVSKVVAPLDTAILDEQRPRSFHKGIEKGEKVNYTTHVGGIFKVMPVKVARMLLNAENVGGDLLRGRFWINKGIDNIYLENLLIEHKGLKNQTKNYKLL